ncbi:hypothetical protein P3S68_020474 [Capsicum galapagoense]
MAKSTNVMGCMIIVLFVLFSPLTLATPETTTPIKLELSGASRSTRISVAIVADLDFARSLNVALAQDSSHFYASHVVQVESENNNMQFTMLLLAYQ